MLPYAAKLAQVPGNSVTVICSPDPSIERELAEINVEFRPVPMGRGLSASGLVSFVRLLWKLAQIKPTCLEYATPNAALYSSVSGWLLRIPLRIYSQWGIRYVGSAGKYRKFLRQMEKLTCRTSTTVRSPSRMNREYGISEGLYGPDKCRVVGEGGTVGVDLKRFSRSKRDEWGAQVREELDLGDALIFGFVGRLGRDKGTRELIEAFQRLPDQPRATLICIGGLDGDASLERFLEDARCNDSIRFLGHKSGHEIPRYLAAIDCLIHPTYREGFGMILQEAGAMGCGIITTAIPGASEVMKDGESCLLVAPRDSRALELAMLRLMGNPEEAKTLGRNAFERTREFFEREAMVSRLVADTMNLMREVS